MRTTLFRLIYVSLFFTLGTGSVSAHTSATTTPKSGAILSESPASIQITFKEAARLTSVVVHHEGKPERKLTFAPSGSATTFNITDPLLEVGKNEIRWIALSTDGHVVKGVIELTLKPAKSG